MIQVLGGSIRNEVVLMNHFEVTIRILDENHRITGLENNSLLVIEGVGNDGA